jgi:hypothetical protein
VAVGKVARVEHLALAVVPLDHEARSRRVDRDDHRGRAIEAVRAVVVAGELELVAGAKLLLHLGERLGVIAAPAGSSRRGESGSR